MVDLESYLDDEKKYDAIKDFVTYNDVVRFGVNDNTGDLFLVGHRNNQLFLFYEGKIVNNKGIPISEEHLFEGENPCIKCYEIGDHMVLYRTKVPDKKINPVLDKEYLVYSGDPDEIITMKWIDKISIKNIDNGLFYFGFNDGKYHCYWSKADDKTQKEMDDKINSFHNEHNPDWENGLTCVMPIDIDGNLLMLMMQYIMPFPYEDPSKGDPLFNYEGHENKISEDILTNNDKLTDFGRNVISCAIRYEDLNEETKKFSDLFELYWVGQDRMINKRLREFSETHENPLKKIPYEVIKFSQLKKPFKNMIENILGFPTIIAKNTETEKYDIFTSKRNYSQDKNLDGWDEINAIASTEKEYVIMGKKKNETQIITTIHNMYLERLGESSLFGVQELGEGLAIFYNDKGKEGFIWTQADDSLLDKLSGWHQIFTPIFPNNDNNISFYGYKTKSDFKKRKITRFSSKEEEQNFEVLWLQSTSYKHSQIRHSRLIRKNENLLPELDSYPSEYWDNGKCFNSITKILNLKKELLPIIKAYPEDECYSLVLSDGQLKLLHENNNDQYDLDNNILNNHLIRFLTSNENFTTVSSNFLDDDN
ncbi:hypothetical protein ACFL1H_06815, partial [Nanoarchaeota archaeon]